MHAAEYDSALKKRRKTAICDNMDEPGEHYYAKY